MTNEEKDLLLQDLCSRLPYMDTMVRWQDEDYQMISIGFGRVTLIKPLMSITAGSPLITEVKPYLRPLSSMTKEEREEYQAFFPLLPRDLMTPSDAIKMFDFLNSHHFDYRGLIPQGLALEALKSMYNN